MSVTLFLCGGVTIGSPRRSIAKAAASARAWNALRKSVSPSAAAEAAITARALTGVTGEARPTEKETAGQAAGLLCAGALAACARWAAPLSARAAVAVARVKSSAAFVVTA